MTTIVDGTTGITFPSTISGVSATQQYSGRILQVVSVNTSSTTTLNSSTPTDVTGLSVSITPTSSSSKIFITVSVPVSAVSIAQFNLVRGSTSIGVGSGGTYNSTFITSCIGNSNYMMTPSFNYLDSPATTSATTYKLQMFTDSNATVNKRTADSVFATTATITVMEISA
jgi:hypothetical protein